ncbi:hypothetical protein PROFUN_01104 [Planoprotostelium fungivorum]|uniref:BPL/LPL catalytic domain-containing protein n=1 Tax=Planoprotostelium fungivorum TaxID=1890364 RepID=A0A2P6NCB2_9EUKA|nr:hypothetical protein PROFUN_01104 [Planoprotostelium fungivorum]
MSGRIHLSGGFLVDTTFQTPIFHNHLKTSFLGRNLIHHQTTTSTMDDALRMAQRGAPHGTLIIAEEQTHGKARKDFRSWSSMPAGNLYFTVILRSAELEPLSLVHFAAPASLAMACRDRGVDAQVKWPNDVWSHNKKLSGMIQPVEYEQEDNSPYCGSYYSMLGVGINVNQDMSKHPDPLLSKGAISLSQIMGKIVSREILLAQFMNHLEENIQKSREGVMSLYRSVDLLSGRTVIIKPKGLEEMESFEASVVEVMDNGQLKVSVNGEEKILMNEEVGEIRPKL